MVMMGPKTVSICVPDPVPLCMGLSINPHEGAFVASSRSETGTVGCGFARVCLKSMFCGHRKKDYLQDLGVLWMRGRVRNVCWALRGVSAFLGGPVWLGWEHEEACLILCWGRGSTEPGMKSPTGGGGHLWGRGVDQGTSPTHA